jgi:hypothetical protein
MREQVAEEEEGRRHPEEEEEEEEELEVGVVRVVLARRSLGSWEEGGSRWLAPIAAGGR